MCLRFLKVASTPGARAGTRHHLRQAPGGAPDAPGWLAGWVMASLWEETMSALSQNRFVLGLGVSGPQVMEGWHGVPFARPLQRTREVIDIVRMIARGERLTYTGEIYQLPLPGGEGKALVSIAQPRPVLLAVASRNRRRRGSRCLRVLNTRQHGSSPVRFCELKRGEIGAHALAE